jgi:hypothetical protein
MNVLPCTSVAVMSAVFFSSGHLCVCVCMCVYACMYKRENELSKIMLARTCVYACVCALGFRV